MAWLMWAGAFACMALAILWPIGTPIVLLLLLAALALLVAGTTQHLRTRLGATPAAAQRLLDAHEMQRLQAQLEARREPPLDGDGV